TVPAPGGHPVVARSERPARVDDRSHPAGAPHSSWLEKWFKTCADLAALKATHPMLDAVIDGIDGRRIKVGGHWLVDFASCNYLGLDLDRDIIDAVPAYLDEWGTHPSWSRLLGSPVLYERIEEKTTALLGAEDVLALPTITHIHMSVLPVLAGGGTVFLDGRAHKTIYDGSLIAASHGAAIKRFRHNDPEHLESLLRSSTATPRVICMDGVNSMTGNAPDIGEFARLARDHDALLYVDDAHGFGVVGERTPAEPCDYGVRGNGVVRYFDEGYDNIVFVAGFSKAYSSLLAFVACPAELKDVLKVAAPPYLYSGPSPVASLATVLAGLEVNERRGDAIRADLHRKTHRVLEFLHAKGVATPNRSGFPIIEVPLSDHNDIHEVGELLFRRGIYVTLAAYPLVPKTEVGFRIQMTAANTDEDVTRLIEVLAEVGERFRLQSPSEAARSTATIAEQPPSPR
ncbi:MAG TPA: pyridoxal phosphate-dependent aminotransferase family protein, partial [Actinomycetota bacterium]|nr:pyridoxal phosphate-dependent aminotransferase family protein [Actinomycetota bacterium]